MFFGRFVTSMVCVCVPSPEVCTCVPFICLLPMHTKLQTQTFHVVSTEPEIKIANIHK